MRCRVKMGKEQKKGGVEGRGVCLCLKPRLAAGVWPARLVKRRRRGATRKGNIGSGKRGARRRSHLTRPSADTRSPTISNPPKMEPSGAAEEDPMALGSVMSDGIQGKRRRNASLEDDGGAFQAVSSSSAPGLEDEEGGVSSTVHCHVTCCSP